MKLIPIVASLALGGMLATGAHAAAYKVAEVAEGGTVTGKVTFSGEDPAPKAYTISKDNGVCGTGERLIDYVRVKDGALLDVVVYLDKVKEGKDFPADVGSATIEQKGCEFKPFLQVMRNDAEAAAINEDSVLHNIHTYELMRGDAKGPKKTVFNVSQPKPGTVTKVVKLKKGPAMKIECDAHDFMHGFVFVARNPYFALVAEDGTFTIDNVPPGKYTVKAWHGMLKNQKAKVEVPAGGAATVDFEFK